MISYKTLETVSMETLHRTFVEAFSDYQIKIEVPIYKLRRMLHRRGFVCRLSMGAFDGDALVGFVLNGARDWQGKPTAYDTGTAVIPSHRKQGITTALFERTKQLLVEQGVEQYLLEVIQTNDPAVALYRKLGFETLRAFNCYDLSTDAFCAKSAWQTEVIDFDKVRGGRQWADFWDFVPSWQNSPDSLTVEPDLFACVVARDGDEIVGYGIVEKKTGDVPQLAVRKDKRRQGIGIGIVAELLRLSEKQTLAFLNVEAACDSMIGFLRAIGAECSVGQYEMMLKLEW